MVFFLFVVAAIFGGNDKDNKDSSKAKTEAVVASIEETSDNPDTMQETAKEDLDPQKSTLESDQNNGTIDYNGSTYQIIEVEGGNLSGSREPNVAVDVGFGDRIYWALTNEYGQLVNVIASQVILQDDSTEPVTADGRYYGDEAKVPGVERDDLDEGHIIADSLGGVSNAYNITPQDSTLNRHGDQAYMEKVIRDAGGCKNFVATITYPDTTTQIPSHYHYEYLLNGEPVADDFDNVNPDVANAAANSDPSVSTGTSGVTGGATPYVTPQPTANSGGDLASVDTNGNGQVTIAEAKAAGYSMPIYSDHWLYPYMDDRDGDGMVGE